MSDSNVFDPEKLKQHLKNILEDSTEIRETLDDILTSPYALSKNDQNLVAITARDVVASQEGLIHTLSEALFTLLDEVYKLVDSEAVA